MKLDTFPSTDFCVSVYILTQVNQIMARIGIIIVVGGMVISMAAAMYAYTQYQTNYIEVNEGDKVTVGSVEYSVMFDGTHGGSETVQANNTFVQIMISAENISGERTPFSGGPAIHPRRGWKEAPGSARRILVQGSASGVA